MGIEIKLDVQAIKAIEDAAVKSAEVAMEQVRTDLISAQTMPFDKAICRIIRPLSTLTKVVQVL